MLSFYIIYMARAVVFDPIKSSVPHFGKIYRSKCPRNLTAFTTVCAELILERKMTVINNSETEDKLKMKPSHDFLSEVRENYRNGFIGIFLFKKFINTIVKLREAHIKICEFCVSLDINQCFKECFFYVQVHESGLMSCMTTKYEEILENAKNLKEVF